MKKYLKIILLISLFFTSFAGTKISDLSQETNIQDTDEVIIRRGANNYRAEVQHLPSANPSDQFNKIKNAYYVSTNVSITDHADTAQSGSIADIITNEMSGAHGDIIQPGNKTYQIKQSLTIPTTARLMPQKGAIIDTDISIRDANYKWTLSGSGTNEYYLEAAAGGNPNINEPDDVAENDSLMTEATVGSLSADEWDWGNNDALGFNTVYVRLSDSTDPDGKAADYVEACYTLTINGPLDAGLYQVFRGSGAIIFGEGSIKEAYPQWTGAVGDGITDDGAAINYLADACRINAIPVYFPPGDYYTTVSLNFSNANNDNPGYTMGWHIYGAGPEATMITGNLAGAYAVVELSDNESSLLSDIRIQGQAGGSQFCGVLHGIVGTNFSIENKLRDVTIAGIFSQAGYINAGPDLARIDHCYIYGPIGTLFTLDPNALGAGVIQSPHHTLGLTGWQGSQHYITNSTIIGHGGDSANWDAAIVIDGVEKLSITNTYIAQDVGAKAGIVVDGEAPYSYGMHSVDFILSRYENQSGAAGTFLWVESSMGVKNCDISGNIGANLPTDAGQMIYLEGGSISFSRLKMISPAASTWAHFIQRTGSAHLITNCEIFEQTANETLCSGVDAALFGGGNIIHLGSWHSNWMNVADNNIFYAGTFGIVTVNPWVGYNSIGTTTSLARKFPGSITTEIAGAATTAAAGDETLDDYTLPGDIAKANTTQNRVSLKVTAFGIFAVNANAKTLKAKFGVSGAETTLISNDITGSPNNLHFALDIDLFRTDTTTGWYIISRLAVGSVTQTTKYNYVAADPDVNTVKFLITGNAAANDIILIGMKLDLF